MSEYPDDLRELVEGYLAELSFSGAAGTSGLDEAMRYSLLAGGKRIRPVLALGAARSTGADPASMLPAAASIELIHTYSLIHDDLPAMDDDALRRGRPTLHVVHGEDVAILAGDGLFAEAINLFLADQQADPANLVAALRELAAATGVDGMVGGQYLDVTADRPRRGGLRRLHAAEDGSPDRRQRDRAADPRRSGRGCDNSLPSLRGRARRPLSDRRRHPRRDRLRRGAGKATWIRRHAMASSPTSACSGSTAPRELRGLLDDQARDALAAISGDTRDLELITDFIRTRES